MFKDIKNKKPVSNPTYFDFSPKEKKKIIKEAAIEANKLQQNLIKRYNTQFPS